MPRPTGNVYLGQKRGHGGVSSDTYRPIGGCKVQWLRAGGPRSRSYLPWPFANCATLGMCLKLSKH